MVSQCVFTQNQRVLLFAPCVLLQDRIDRLSL